MAILKGLVKDNSGNPAANIKIKIYREDTWEIIGEGITGDGTTLIQDPYWNKVSKLITIENGLIVDKANPGLGYGSYGNILVSNDSRVGTGSVLFDGASNFFSYPYNVNLEPLGNDFTIEFDFKVPNLTGNKSIFSFYSDFHFGVFILGNKVAVYFSSNGTSWNIMAGDTSGNLGLGNTVITANTWYNYSITKINNVYSNRLNGNIDKINTISSIVISRKEPFILGSWYRTANWMNGNIDQFRFTNGVGRYTSNYTPTNKPHPVNGGSSGGPLGTYNINTKDYIGPITIMALADPSNNVKNHIFERKNIT